MRVLVVERERGNGTQAAAKLEGHGHEVVRCDDADPSSERLCAGLPGGSGCPLDDQPVDVAVAVRGDAGGPNTERETGIRCALRQRVPVMVLGSADGASYADWVDEVTEMEAPALDQRVTELGRAGLAAIASIVAGALRPLLAMHGVDGSAIDVTMTRSDGRARVHVRIDAPLDAKLRQTCAVRAVAALRDLQPSTDGVDVEVVGTGDLDA
ncbi:MAG TPA: hypothetical protein VMT43_00130 [Acidimicrobiales bacterium]|nr:hypothetical protein [Acidimicrobiales bacterium]